MLRTELRNWARRRARRGRGAGAGLGRGCRRVRGGAGRGSVRTGAIRDAGAIAWDDSGRSAHSDVHGVAGRLSDGVKQKSLYYVNWPVAGEMTQENGNRAGLSHICVWRYHFGLPDRSRHGCPEVRWRTRPRLHSGSQSSPVTLVVFSTDGSPREDINSCWRTASPGPKTNLYDHGTLFR